MNKPLLLLLILLFAGGAFYALPRYTRFHLPLPALLIAKTEVKKEAFRLKQKAETLRSYASQKGFSSRWCFLVDLSLPSGRNRFFIYDLVNDTVVKAGLVAHGSCNTRYLEKVWFSNQPGCGCSASGKYRVGSPYKGRFGKAFKLYGLDSTNSNAFARAIVLHAYEGVPEKETHPQPICNSLGCPMVSYGFLAEAAKMIEHSPKPILLYVFPLSP